jgi:amidase
MLDAICGADPGSPYVIAGPERPFLEEVDREPGSLKIAFTSRSPLGTEVHPECRKAVEDAARLLADLGHKVDEAEPGIDGTALAKSYLTMYFGEISADILAMEKVLGRKPRYTDVEGPTWILNTLGKAFTAGEFVLSMREWNTFTRQMGTFHLTYDIFLTPTLAFPPVRIGELQPKPAEKFLMKIVNPLNLGKLIRMSGIVDKLAVENMAKTPFTQMANLTGQPAVSVPLHWTPDGLPCGVQLIAPFGDEAALFRLSAQLEKARPWFDKRPAMNV